MIQTQMRNILQNNWHVPFQSVNVIKQKGLRTCSRGKETKGM